MSGKTSKLVPDNLWGPVQPLLPKPRRRRSRYPGRNPIEDRKVLTGINFVLRTGISWRELLTELVCGSRMICLRRLKQWHQVTRRVRIRQISRLATVLHTQRQYPRRSPLYYPGGLRLETDFPPKLPRARHRLRHS